MNVQKLELDGLLLIEPAIHRDERGYFCETWHAERYREVGLPTSFAQDNLSWSRRDTLRGLHFQRPRPQAKLVYVLVGEIYDVAVDIRPSSPTFGRWLRVTLSAANAPQLYVPEGFAHGFCVTSDEALVAYKCTAPYERSAQHVFAWNDPDLAIDWPVREPLVSPQDRQAPRLAEVLPDLTLGVAAHYSGAYDDRALP
jgi:dTDP-4-dehydrorhamnose 3,5-epimerase